MAATGAPRRGSAVPPARSARGSCAAVPAVRTSVAVPTGRPTRLSVGKVAERAAVALALTVRGREGRGDSKSSTAPWVPADDGEQPVRRRTQAFSPEALLVGPSLGLRGLQVLTLTGQPLAAEALAQALEANPLLEALDASRCGLTSVPPANAWAGLRRLALVALHQNELRQWEDASGVLAAPELVWLTLFRNPVACRPGYRGFLVDGGPQLLAVDFQVVSDAERMARRLPQLTLFSRSSPSAQRFGNQLTSVRPWEDGACGGDSAGGGGADEHDVQATCVEMLRGELRQLRHQSNHASAACCIQACWRGWAARGAFAVTRARLVRAVHIIQRSVRGLLWRRGVHQYVREYLQEIDQLELLLDAKQMHMEQARKKIFAAVRQWLHRLRLERQRRVAASLLSRVGRSAVVGWKMFREKMELQEFNKVYFPTRVSWEFLVAMNLVRRKHGMEPLPVGYDFPVAEFIAVRMPDQDEASARSTSLLAVSHAATRCILRPRRCGRFPDCPWDGPTHQLVDPHAPPAIQQAYQKLRRRAAHVDTRCRGAFLASCAPGPHPVDAAAAGGTGELEPRECRGLQDFLHGPEDEWPAGARNAKGTLLKFLQEARRTGAKRWQPGRGASEKGERGPQGVRSYRNTCWLAEQMRFYPCENDRVARDVMVLLLNFSRELSETRGIPSLEQVPFLPEFLARRIAAATCIQAAWSARRARRALPCGLLTAAVVRRAALLIQRGMRWSRLRRRLSMLSRAVQAVRAVTGPCLYIEERLYNALNVVAGVDRYPPSLQEQGLGFGYSASAKDVVLVPLADREPGRRRASRAARRSLRPAAGADAEAAGRELPTPSRLPRASSPLLSPCSSNAPSPRIGAPRGSFGMPTEPRCTGAGEPRRRGFPAWFQGKVGQLKMATADDAGDLKAVSGLRGLLTEGLGDRLEEHTVEASFPTLRHLSLGGGQQAAAEAAAAAQASGGTLRFVELRYASVQAARRRALAVFMCTYSFAIGTAVPLLARPMLQDWDCFYAIISLWQRYGLDWPAERNQVSLYQFRQRAVCTVDAVPLNGGQRWAARGERAAAHEPPSVARREREEAATLQRYSALSEHIEGRRRREHEVMQEQFRDLERQHASLRDAFGAPAAREVQVRGTIPPTTGQRTAAVPDSIARAEKEAARSLAAASRQADQEERKALHDSARLPASTDHLDFERRNLAFHALCDEQRAEAERAKHIKNHETEEEALRKKVEHVRTMRKAQKAETQLLESKQRFENMQRCTQAQVDAANELHAHKLQRQHEVGAVREKVAAEKAKAADRREAMEAVRSFQAKRACLEKLTSAQGRAQARHEDRAEAASTVRAMRLERAERASATACRQRDDSAQLRRMAEGQKSLLAAQHALRAVSEDEDLRAKQERLKEQKPIGGLLRAANEELGRLLRDAVADSDEEHAPGGPRGSPPAQQKGAAAPPWPPGGLPPPCATARPAGPPNSARGAGLAQAWRRRLNAGGSLPPLSART